MAEEKDTKKKPAAKPRSQASKAKKPAGKKPAAKQAASKPKAPAKPRREKRTEAKPKQEAKTKAPAKKAEPKREPKPKAAPKKKGAPERPVVNARARFVRVAPRKARMVANQVRGLPIDDARALLRFSSRGAARDIVPLIDTAAANAEANHDLVADDLLIKDIHVDDGPTLRRYRPRALGRATRINKRTSHIAVALTPEE
jgi:ribosomal protein L22